jgi:hypothetical protein
MAKGRTKKRISCVLTVDDALFISWLSGRDEWFYWETGTVRSRLRREVLFLHHGSAQRELIMDVIIY